MDPVFRVLEALRSSVSWCREQWLLPVLARLLPHMQQRLTASWQRQLSPANGAGANGTAGRSAAEADVVQVRLLRTQSLHYPVFDARSFVPHILFEWAEAVAQERLLRELTREHVDVLAALAEAGSPQPKGANSHPRRRCPAADLLQDVVVPTPVCLLAYPLV